MKFVLNYFKQVIQELKKVSWPTKKQTINKTVLVLVVSTIVAVYVGGLDLIFQKMIQALLKI